MLTTIITTARFSEKTGNRLKGNSNRPKKYRRALEAAKIQYTEDVYLSLDDVPQDVWDELSIGSDEAGWKAARQEWRAKMQKNAAIGDIYHVFRAL